jgi:molecular chaperone HscA
VFQVLAVGGDTKLDGDDFDHPLSSIVLYTYGAQLSFFKHTKFCSYIYHLSEF